MSRLLPIALVAGLLFGTAPVKAAEFTTIPSIGLVQLKGDIVKGDTERLIAAARALEEETGRSFAILGLESDGGNVAEGLKMADAIHNTASLQTAVGKGAECSSICAIVFAAGRGHLIGAGARVGVHCAYKSTGETDWAATYMMAMAMSAYGAPHVVVERMLANTTHQVTILSDGEMLALLASSPAVALATPAAIARQYDVGCVGRKNRMSSFHVTKMTDGTTKVYSTDSDMGAVIFKGVLDRACSSLPAGTEIAGQWQG